MKTALRLMSQTFAFLITVVLLASVNLNPLTDGNFYKKPSISVAKSDSGAQTSDEQTPNNPNPSEEDNDDIALLEHKMVEPYGYSAFVPLDQLPFLGHSFSPLHRPPLI